MEIIWTSSAFDLKSWSLKYAFAYMEFYDIQSCETTFLHV